MNYLLPVSVPKEITASILFYAIAAANRGWTDKVAEAQTRELCESL